MFFVHSHGRMGNQLFQYAFTTSLEKNLGAKGFFVTNEQYVLHKYFDGVPRPLPCYLTVKRILLSSLYRALKLDRLDLTGGEVKSHLGLVRDGVVYKGFFQSRKYFASLSRRALQEQFVLKKSHVDKFHLKYKDLFDNNKIITIHVRKTDYLNFGNENLGGKDLSLPFSFFEKCLDQVENVSDYKIIFVSDDINQTKAYFGENRNYIYSQESEIIDFQLLKNADICILSNSSFSWWGAYLNSRAIKIYAPKDWLGFMINRQVPDEIIPGEFSQIEVN